MSSYTSSRTLSFTNCGCVSNSPITCCFHHVPRFARTFIRSNTFSLSTTILAMEPTHPSLICDGVSIKAFAILGLSTVSINTAMVTFWNTHFPSFVQNVSCVTRAYSIPCTYAVMATDWARRNTMATQIYDIAWVTFTNVWSGAITIHASIVTNWFTTAW